MVSRDTVKKEGARQKRKYKDNAFRLYSFLISSRFFAVKKNKKNYLLIDKIISL